MFRKSRRSIQQREPEAEDEELDTSSFLSLDLLFELTKERNKIQLEQTDKLDSKAITVLTSATAIVSAALILQAVLQPSPNTSLVYTLLQRLPIALLMIFYLLAMIAGLTELMIRTYKLTPDPSRLYERYLMKHPEYTKAKVYKSMVDDYNVNEDKIEDLVYWIKMAIVALWIEAIAFVFFLFVHTLL